MDVHQQVEDEAKKLWRKVNNTADTLTYCAHTLQSCFIFVMSLKPRRDQFLHPVKSSICFFLLLGNMFFLSYGCITVLRQGTHDEEYFT